MRTQIPINLGSMPDTDTQVNNPRLSGGFVDSAGQIKLLPFLQQVLGLQDVRAAHRSTFDNRLIVVTRTEVGYFTNEGYSFVTSFESGTDAVRIDENAKNEVTIVNGSQAAVYAQQTESFFILGLANGFDLTNPVDVCVLDTITVIVGGTDKRWITSEADNAANYGGNEAVLTDESLGNLTGCEDLDNNLFIFGTGGVQRWVPSIERTTSSFPFSQDPNYRDAYGCKTTSSLISANNEMYYLTSDDQIRLISSEEGSAIITNDGLDQLIKSFDATQAFGSYFFYKGYYLYYVSFLREGEKYFINL